jgi:hypothetical protein
LVMFGEPGGSIIEPPFIHHSSPIFHRSFQTPPASEHRRR